MRVGTSFLAASAAAVLGLSAPAQATPVTGLAGGLSRGNALFSFDTAAPGTVSALRTITGLQAAEGVLGIDYRPANGLLYGLGSTGMIYTIDPGTGAATPVLNLTVPLSGGAVRFDIAFNPVADLLRVVGDDGQNLRVNVDTGVVTADTRLAYASGDANFGRGPGVTAVAYTNQFAGAGTTTLYDLDRSNGVLAIQNPPNNGTLNTVGPLGATSLTLVSFDIDALTGAAYAASADSFYQIDLTTGASSFLGTLGVNSNAPSGQNTTDFALVPTAVPEPMSLALLGAGLLGLGMARHRRPGG